VIINKDDSKKCAFKNEGAKVMIQSSEEERAPSTEERADVSRRAIVAREE